MTRTVYVLPHCHWDREWYQPHEVFRWRLVQMIDELLDHMEQHPDFRCFTLDGQAIVIDDYLQIRPENEPRLRAMLESGRIVIGPWWVQPDEFLPTGESHIRSLQRGIRFADRLGGSLRVGHCADQFGHIAQMPQLMSQLGLTSACLWRGVPDAVPGWSFRWEAPDGTRLPVLYLRNSYSSGWRLPSEPAELIERVRRQERDLRDDEPALLMNGTDHSRMEKHVPAALGAAADHGYDFRLATLGEYERARLEVGIDELVHEGELRSPDRSNVLAGVLSTRIDIKQRDFEVSRALERYAEPLELLSWLHHGPDGLPALRHAWGLQLENSPHDSICGCSVDQTHREMFPRYDRAEQLARQVARESMGQLVRRLDVPEGGGIAAFRAVPHAPAVLACEVPDTFAAESLRLPDGREVPVALSRLSAPETLYDNSELSSWGALRHLDFIREDRWDAHYVEAMEWRLEERHLRVETTVGDDLCSAHSDQVREAVHNIVANSLATTAEVHVVRSGRQLLRAVLPPSDTIGIELLVAGDGQVEESDIAATSNSIANRYYEVRFRKGRLQVHDWQNGLDLENPSLFVDEGDRGDEYNADILPNAIVEPLTCQLVSIERDAVSATLRYLTVLEVPARLTPSRKRRTRKSRVLVPILTDVTLWSGLTRVDFHVTVDNTAADHRLRALFPLPFGVSRVFTENQFHVAERSLTPQAWNGVSTEQPPTTFPQKTFAAFESAGAGIAVFNRGLQEGEVVRRPNGGQAYALTLVRCVGWLSRTDLVSRRGGAGPSIATEDSQLPGEHSFDYALTTYRGSWRDAGVQPLAHSFAYPPVAWATNAHEGSMGHAIPLLTIPDSRIVPSAFHRSDADGAPIVRVYNSSAEAVTAELRAPAASDGAGLVDLLERHAGLPERVDDSWRFPLRPWQIQSLRFGRR